MTRLLDQFDQQTVAKLMTDKKYPAFAAGDLVKVHVQISEGANVRIQPYEGVCIAKRNRGLHSSFTVRKISNGEGVERVFPIYSPAIKMIEVIKYGVVRRAKLYYLRERSGKSARIAERRVFVKSNSK